MNSTSHNSFLLSIGLVAAIAMACGDIILLGQPVSGSYYDLASFGAMEHTERLRSAVGALSGMISAFLMCLGFAGVKELFFTDSPNRAKGLFWAFCSMSFFSGVFHAGYFFLANDDDLIHPLIIVEFHSYLTLVAFLAVPGALIGSALFFRLASNKRFPGWCRLCNPVVLNLLLLAIFYFIPSPAGGYIRPAFTNIALAIFFIAALRINREIARHNPKIIDVPADFEL